MGFVASLEINTQEAGILRNIVLSLIIDLFYFLFSLECQSSLCIECMVFTSGEVIELAAFLNWSRKWKSLRQEKLFPLAFTTYSIYVSSRTQIYSSRNSCVWFYCAIVILFYSMIKSHLNGGSWFHGMAEGVQTVFTLPTSKGLHGNLMVKDTFIPFRKDFNHHSGCLKCADIFGIPSRQRNLMSRGGFLSDSTIYYQSFTDL